MLSPIVTQRQPRHYGRTKALHDSIAFLSGVSAYVLLLAKVHKDDSGVVEDPLTDLPQHSRTPNFLRLVLSSIWLAIFSKGFVQYYTVR